MPEPSLRITEVFYSLQGEARDSGHPTVFVRLTGCPLRCGYCDSEYAFHGGERLTFNQLLEQVNQYPSDRVCVTGGEPLAQAMCRDFLVALCNAGYKVSLETSGAMDIGNIDPRVSIVMDLKTPGSGELEKNLWSNIGKLSEKDQIKFVICDRRDFEWAEFKIDEHALYERTGDVLISPCYGELEPSTLARWILESQPKARFQIQLHKLLWGDIPGV